jgi:hypothetical protein
MTLSQLRQAKRQAKVTVGWLIPDVGHQTALTTSDTQLTKLNGSKDLQHGVKSAAAYKHTQSLRAMPR